MKVHTTKEQARKMYLLCKGDNSVYDTATLDDAMESMGYIYYEGMTFEQFTERNRLQLFEVVAR